MDCRIIDSKIVVKDGNIVSVSPYYFGINKRNTCYYWTVVRVVHNDQAKVKRYEDKPPNLYLFFFFKLGFIPYKAKQPLQGMKLQEKKTKKD